MRRVTESHVRDLAALARLPLDATEIAGLAGDFDILLDHLHVLDTVSNSPETLPNPDVARLREDVASHSPSTIPQQVADSHGGYFLADAPPR